MASKPWFSPTGSLEPPSKVPRVELDQEDTEGELLTSESESENEIENKESENEVEKEESVGVLYYDEGVTCRKECCLVTRNEPYHLVNIN